MKTIYTILLLCVLSQSLIAQNEKFSTSSEIGINVKTLLDEFLFGKEIIAGQQLVLPNRLDPIITFKYNYAKNYTMRIGGGYQQQEVQDTFVSAGFAEFITTQRVRSVYMNFGFQKQFHLQKRLMAYWGFDFLYRNGRNKFTNEQKAIGGNQFLDDFTSSDIFIKNDFGIGIPMGVQYYFSNNISISTEMNTEFLAVFSKTKSENSQSNPITNEEGDRYQARIHPPISLFLNFQF